MNRHGKSFLSDLLAVASITKTLSKSGHLYLPEAGALPLSEDLLRRILESDSLHPSKKLQFFRWCSAHLPKPSPESYSHLLRTLCRSGFLSDASDLLRDARRSGLPLDPPAFGVLLRAFARSGDFESAIEVIGAAEESGIRLDAKMYDPIMIALVKKGKMNSALSLFLKILDDSSQVPSRISCNELLVGLRKFDMKVEFRRVFDGVREKKGFAMNVRGYNICIHAFGMWGDLGTCFRLFKEMKDSVGPDLWSYNSLIHVLCFVGKLKDGLAVFQELKEFSGFQPNQVTFGILIHGCCKSYRVHDAVQVFSQMRLEGHRPGTVEYNSLLDGLFKARRLDDACVLFERMVREGVRASSWTYNVLIDGLFRNGRAEAGYTVFCDLKQKKGTVLDDVTYSIVVQQLCKEGLIGEALKLVEEMEGRGFVVNLVTITSLLIGMYRNGRWDWMERLMKHIRDANLVTKVLRWKLNMDAAMKEPQSKAKDYTPMFPSKGEFTELMNLIRSADRSSHEANEADEWSPPTHTDKLAEQALDDENFTRMFPLCRVKRVQEKEQGVGSFHIDMVNTFLSIFLAKGKLSKACKLFEIFTDMGVNPVNYTYNSIMTSFIKKGYFDEAWNILDAMGEKLCPMDLATYNVVIQGLGLMGRADLASAILDKLMEQGCSLDLVMYNTLINVLGKDRRMDEVGKLFEQMRGSGIVPDIFTYNTLIEVHAKAGKLEDAQKFLKMMMDNGCVPDRVTDRILDFLGKEIEKERATKSSEVRPTDHGEF